MWSGNETFWRTVVAVETVLIFGMLSLALFRPEPERIPAGTTGLMPLANASSRVDITAPPEESSTVKYWIDSLVQIGNYLKVVGWAYVENQPSEGQLKYVMLEANNGTGQSYTTTRSERPDVAATFSNSLYEASGFSAFIPLTNGIDLADGTLRILIIGSTGTYLSQAWNVPCRSR